MTALANGQRAQELSVAMISVEAGDYAAIAERLTVCFVDRCGGTWRTRFYWRWGAGWTLGWCGTGTGSRGSRSVRLIRGMGEP